MPHTPSAAKRLRKTEKRKARNKLAAKKIKVARKSVAEALKTGDPAAALTAYQGKEGQAGAQAVLDRMAGKGYIHPNKAARLKSRLVKRTRAAANKSAAPSAK
jgi:small subunit ribosomal protein S20